jgi:hypothetical protein
MFFFPRLGVTTVLLNAKRPKSLSGMARYISLVPKIILQNDFYDSLFSTERNSEDLDTCVWEKAEVPI